MVKHVGDVEVYAEPTGGKKKSILFGRVPLPVMERDDLTPHARLMYGAMAMHASTNRSKKSDPFICDVERRVLMENIGLKTLEGVSKCLRQLIDKGLIKKIKVRNGKKTAYTFTRLADVDL